jgi:hypothetical protein
VPRYSNALKKWVVNSMTLMNVNIHQACKKKSVRPTGRLRKIKIANTLVQFKKDAHREEKALTVQVILEYCKVTHPDFVEKRTARKANLYASLMQVIQKLAYNHGQKQQHSVL